MPKVTFLPAQIEVETENGASILETAIAHSIALDHACGGNCACTTCHVIIEAGGERLSEMDCDEEDKLDTIEDVTMKSRLGCQSRIHGDITVRLPPRPWQV